MRPDVHRAALRAATKVAFAAVFLNGCGGATEQPAQSGEAASRSDGNRAATPPDTEAGTDAGAEAGTGAGTGAEAGAPTSCDATLATTFPAPSDYKWSPEARSADVVSCCLDELTKNVAVSKYLWDCCVAYDAQDPEKKTVAQHDDLGIACTPWGPPVPPSAQRARRPSPAVAAWIARAVAA